MSTVLHPVGPQAARVYWVRRLLVLLLVAALVVGSATLVSWLRGDGGDAGAAAATEQGSAEEGDGAAAGAGDTADDATGSADGAAADAAGSDAAGSDDAGSGGTGADESGSDDAGSDDAAPAAPVDCVPAALQVTLTSADVEFAPATHPVLTATVTNVGDVPCTVDAGDASREVLITSGEDRVWSSKDCATDERASRQLLLAAGAADSQPIEWARVRSAEGCPADLPAPRAGTYQAVATLGAATSQTVVFILE